MYFNNKRETGHKDDFGHSWPSFLNMEALDFPNYVNFFVELICIYTFDSCLHLKAGHSIL